VRDPDPTCEFVEGPVVLAVWRITVIDGIVILKAACLCELHDAVEIIGMESGDSC
jgi:hypothetical protein